MITLRKFSKFAVWFCVIVFCALSIAAYYINFIYTDSRPPSPSSMKEFLVDTKDEVWLNKRIEEGKLNYRKLVQQKRKLVQQKRKLVQQKLQAWDEETQTFQNTLEACKLGSDAYRMKNSYECNDAWKKLGGYGEFKPYLLNIIDVSKKRKFVDKENLEKSQGEMIDDAILRDCKAVKTIRQARKMGCYY